jgi:glutamyl-tRNA synthetase
VLSEIVPMVDFAFLDEPVDDPESWAKAMQLPTADELLEEIERDFSALAPADWAADVLKTKVIDRGTSYGLKLGKAQAPVRVAVTGRTVGLPLFESLEVLGQQRTLLRLRAARERLESLT